MSVEVLFRTRTFNLLDPYAGEFKPEYIDFITQRVVMFGDRDALLCLRENVWLVEGRLELIRKWETPKYRAKLIKRMDELGVIKRVANHNQRRYYTK